MSNLDSVLAGLMDLEGSIVECRKCAVSLQGDSEVLVDVGRRLRNITSDVKRVKESLDYMAKSQGAPVSQSVSVKTAPDSSPRSISIESKVSVQGELSDDEFDKAFKAAMQGFYG
jgi:hypothetical protein